MTAAEDAQQQERALDCAGNLRIYASQVRQMGFKNLAKEYEKQAKLAEKWALNIVKVKRK